ncbi:hypothetical protein SCB49_05210 [unidentified eubacterium SCB49]|nr:hypothetical protein SCB49_05210 [unidentified eubacterium SCB49]
MKKLALIIAVAFVSFSQMNAQQFETTDAYFVSLASTLGEDGLEVQSAILATASKSPEEITSFPVADASLIYDVHINKMENPGLSGVKSILKVDVKYVEYCSFVVSNYILETESGGYITLPILTNEDCGDSDKEIVYLFPNQAFGQANQIVTSEITVQEKNVLAAEQYDTFIWNDDSYGSSGSLYNEL